MTVIHTQMIFENHAILVEFDYEPGVERTFHEEGSAELLFINRVWYQGAEISDLMGEDMLDKLHAQLLREKGMDDD